MKSGRNIKATRVGVADHGTGHLLVHRWHERELGTYLSVCGAAVTRSISQCTTGAQCKRCFRGETSQKAPR